MNVQINKCTDKKLTEMICEYTKHGQISMFTKCK
jgi:hypothetical protein